MTAQNVAHEVGLYARRTFGPRDHVCHPGTAAGRAPSVVQKLSSDSSVLAPARFGTYRAGMPPTPPTYRRADLAGSLQLVGGLLAALAVIFILLAGPILFLLRGVDCDVRTDCGDSQITSLW